MPKNRDEYLDDREQQRETAELFRRQAEEGRKIAEGFRGRKEELREVGRRAGPNMSGCGVPRKRCSRSYATEKPLGDGVRFCL